MPEKETTFPELQYIQTKLSQNESLSLAELKIIKETTQHLKDILTDISETKQKLLNVFGNIILGLKRGSSGYNCMKSLFDVISNDRFKITKKGLTDVFLRDAEILILERITKKENNETMMEILDAAIAGNFGHQEFLDKALDMNQRKISHDMMGIIFAIAYADQKIEGGEKDMINLLKKYYTGNEKKREELETKRKQRNNDKDMNDHLNNIPRKQHGILFALIMLIASSDENIQDQEIARIKKIVSKIDLSNHSDTLAMTIVYLLSKNFKHLKEITDSINYAKRIQEAMLPTQEQMKKHFPGHFLMFKPKDIVSGDFYRIKELEDGKIAFTAADCTGHGVPGAFMSMLGIALLNDINNGDAGSILDIIRERIKISLKQQGIQGEQQDGFDSAIGVRDPEKKTLNYAGANRPFYIVRNGELINEKTDKMPVGVHAKDNKPFQDHTIQLESNDMLYLFSDGYEDQFGGPNNRKFLIKKLRNLLLEISNKNEEEQKNILKINFEERKGEYDQIDDIVMLGIRIQ